MRVLVTTVALVALVVLLGGCISEQPSEGPGGGEAGGGGLDAEPVGDDGGPFDASVRPDGSPSDGGPVGSDTASLDVGSEGFDLSVDGGGEPDTQVATDTGPSPCLQACKHLADCSLERCPAMDAPAAEALEQRCLAACDDNPSLAVVLDAGRSCEEVVAFGRSWAGPDYEAACRRRDEPLPDGGPCPWPCQGDEVCNGGHCVRPDGSCVTDYHCFTGREQCVDERCQPAQFAPCYDDSDCMPEVQFCRSTSPNPAAPGACFIGCEAPADCPINETCVPEAGNICYFALCGGSAGNGTPHGPCEVADAPGACYPLAAGDLQPGGAQGICLEGGAAPMGAPCDAQAVGRTPEDVALRCDAGLICFGDPDQPLDPEATPDGLGTCMQLCDPRDAACGEGMACLDLTVPDNPATPRYDETRPLGICLATDCEVLGEGPGCADGQVCEMYSPLATFGHCRPAGDAAAGQPCEQGSDCAGLAICGDDGRGGQMCIDVCDPMAPQACAPGQRCWAEPGWALGFCIAG